MQIDWMESSSLLNKTVHSVKTTKGFNCGNNKEKFNMKKVKLTARYKQCVRQNGKRFGGDINFITKHFIL